MTPKELEIKYKNGLLKTKGGTFWFCGAYPFGKAGDNFYKLENIEFNQELNFLKVTSEHGIAKIINPSGIIEEKKGYGGYRFGVNCDKIIFEYSWNSELNEVEYYVQNGNAYSKHSNGYTQEKRPFEPYSIFEFGE
jgi:hypothetical protein